VTARASETEDLQPYRDIALLAETQFLCFLFLAEFEPRFVVIRLYQSVGSSFIGFGR
jgi:hypothetical protein